MPTLTHDQLSALARTIVHGEITTWANEALKQCRQSSLPRAEAGGRAQATLEGRNAAQA